MIFRPQILLSILLLAGVSVRAADHLSNPLADAPNWKSLEKFQKTIGHDEFERLLRGVYCTHGIGENLIRIDPEAACILMDRDAQSWFRLRFAASAAKSVTVPRWWRPARALPPSKKRGPLSGLKIALDPGHIGGAWARMEERWYKSGEGQPVEEGEMTLRVAKMLGEKLR